jgi:hypothetical protein
MFSLHYATDEYQVLKTPSELVVKYVTREVIQCAKIRINFKIDFSSPFVITDLSPPIKFKIHTAESIHLNFFST